MYMINYQIFNTMELLVYTKLPFFFIFKGFIICCTGLTLSTNRGILGSQKKLMGINLVLTGPIYIQGFNSKVVTLIKYFLRIINKSPKHRLHMGFTYVFIAPIGLICLTNFNNTYICTHN